MKKLLILLIVFGFSAGSLFAQTKTLKGRVIDDFLDPIPFALIMINDTVEVGKTDLQGYFKVKVPFLAKRIEFMQIGYEQTTIEVIDECNELEVMMMADFTYDFITLKKVDRLRMKRFKQLPILRKQAFEKGIFKTEKPCYTQDFIPIYKKKQKK